MEVVRYSNILNSGQLASSTSAAQIFDASTLLRTAPITAYGVCVTNNDPSATLYIGWDNSVASTKFFQAILPNASYEISAGEGVLNKLWLVASAGTPNVFLTVFG
jgi:hypothetical protein